VLAGLCLLLADPPRGAQDALRGAAVRSPAGAAPSGSMSHDAGATYRRLLRNPPYLLTVAGYAAYTFAMGGLAYWIPAFLERSRGIPRAEATVSFGEIVVITGFIGTFAGGWLGDYGARFSKQAYLWLSAIATLLAVPFVWMALTTRSHDGYLAAMVIAQLLMFLSTGPINAAIVNLVAPIERASAVALSIFAIHVLGDAVSPALIGILSDAASLARAVLVVPVAVLVSAALWFAAARAQQHIRAPRPVAA
jgi:nitrate/nitrite transporter NarK